jgi:hypothetical protein
MSNSTKTTKTSDKPATSNAHSQYLATLTQAPIISPAFALTLKTHAGQCVLDWVSKNAPAEIIDLVRAVDGLNEYHHEWELSGGTVSADSNGSITRTVTEAINAVEMLTDGAWAAF